jgi:hypothetical protein
VVKVSHVGVKRDALPANPMPIYEDLCRGGTHDVVFPERRFVNGMYVKQDKLVRMKAK